jgi:hypothetical protein
MAVVAPTRVLKGNTLMTYLSKLRTRCALTALSAGVLLAACGGGGGGGGAPVTPPADQPPVARQFDPAAAAQLNTQFSVDPNASDPVVGSDAAGNLIAVWVEPDGERNNVFARRFDAATQSFDAPVRIGLDNGDGSNDLRLKVNANGDAVATWELREEDNAGHVEDNVVVSVYQRTSNQWKTERLTDNSSVNTQDDSTLPDVAFGPEGMIAAVWREKNHDFVTGTTTDFFSLRSAIYNPSNQTWGNIEPVTGGATPATEWTEPRVAVLPSKDVVVASIARNTANANDFDIDLFRRNASSGKWGPGNLDSTGGPTEGVENIPAATDGIDSLQLAANDKGQVQIVWRHKFDGNGRQLIASAFLGSNTKTWVVPGQVDSTAGDPNGCCDRFTTEGKDSLTPNVVMDAKGIATVVWRQEASFDNGDIKDIYARQFNTNTGSYVGEPQLIEQNPNNTDSLPALAVDALGNVFAGWTQLSAVNPGGLNIRSLYASRFDASTQVWSSPALVEADDSATVLAPGIAMAPDGTAMSVWLQAKRIMFNRFK